MNSAYRMALMLSIIPRYPRKVDTGTISSRLAEENFKVTRRTIQRDLEQLSSVFPIACDDTSKPYGWHWTENAELFTLPRMDTFTAFSFKMVEKFLASAMPPSIIRSLELHLNLADKILTKLLPLDQFKAWPDKIRFLSRSQRLSPPEIKPEVLEIVYESLLTEKRFNAIYRRREDEAPIDYVINPLGIVLLDSVIYLVCTLWNYDRLQDVRQLALHRILSATKSEEPSLAPKNFSMQAYIDTAAFHYLRSEEMIALEVLFDKKVAIHLYETPLSADQKISDVDESWVKVQATVADTSQLRWWLLGFGPQVEVLAPKFLRKEFKMRAQDLANIYKKGDA
ncbi:WYL domain-containing protein [Desulfococcaceae bacterium OttesenSCG-928-F15]|nr:WYL domain-containing protein [Desulfococcaceae bacterium OttesenSCG-928-F15]